MDRIATLEEFLREDPDDAFTRFALAQEHRKSGDLTAALRYFEGLVQDHPDYVGTYYHLAALYQVLGRPDDTTTTLRSGINVATKVRDFHARAELQSALLEAEGLGADDY